MRNTELTLLEIEQIREAIRGYAEEHIGPVTYTVIEALEAQREGYDFAAACKIHFTNGTAEGHVLGINRDGAGGFEVPLD